MHEIRIIDIVPLHELITLVVFEDETIGEVDAKLLRNSHGELNPVPWGQLLPQQKAISSATVAALQKEIDHSEFAENLGNSVITIEVEEPLYSEFIQWCKSRDIEAERVLQAFLRFCTEENEDAIQAWIDDCHRRAMLDAIVYANGHIYTQEQVERDFDSILAVVESGVSPVLIRADNGSELLLFGWEDYWSRFSCYEPAGERKRIEALCAVQDAAEDVGE